MNLLLTRLPMASTLAMACLMITEVSVARDLNGGSETVVPGDPSEDWTLWNGAVLNVLGGQTGSILSTGTTTKLNLQGSSTTTDDVGVELQQGSTAIISNASITSTGDSGVLLAGSFSNDNRSQATIIGSSITGIGRGVSVAFGDVVLSGSAIYGRDDGNTGFLGGGKGLALFSGNALVNNSSNIVGDENGILISPESIGGDVGRVSTLTVDGSHVEGLAGSAIIIGSYDDNRPSEATVVIQNGATLTGGNGVVLEVANNSSADVTVDNSHLVGDVLVQAGSNADLILQNNASITGQLTNVENLALNSGGRWNMVADGEVDNLSMSGGVVNLGGDGSSFYRLSLGSLSGTGTFIIPVDFQTGQVGFLDVTGNATGNHQLSVAGSGVDPLNENDLHIVHTAGGDAQFSLIGGRVDVGTYSYSLTESSDGHDWYLDPSKKTISPSTSTVLSLFNTTPTVWYGELSTLRSRMGEVRMGNGAPGLWARGYGNKYDISTSSGVGYQQTQQGLSFGADARVPGGDGQWLAGVMGGYSKSDLSLTRGSSGTVNSYYAGLYTTWLDSQSGYYFDALVKLNRFQNDAKVSMSDGARSKGDYTTHGAGASAEFGRHIKLDDGYFVEPYTQLSGVVIQGKNYGLDNGMQAQGDRTHSLLGKVGSTVGRNFDLGHGRTIQPYVRVAYAHEFAKSNNVRINDTTFNNDLSGSRGELGAGIAIAMTDKVQIHADFDYSNGRNIEQPWGANVGVRYNW